MKKIVCAMGLLVLFSAMTVCLAGDIPESLRNDDHAQVYFGEIKRVDGDSITIIQRQNIKGSFTQDAEITYTKFGFTDHPEEGGQYLCGFLDENNPVYIWEVTGFDTSTLAIKNDDAMSKRMQEYLNSGDFAEQPQDHDEADAPWPPAEAASAAPATSAQPQTPANSSITADGSGVLMWILGVGLVLGLAVLVWRRRSH